MPTVTSTTLTVSPFIAPSTNVQAYRAEINPSGPPPGNPLEQHTASATGVVTFTTLTDGESYYAVGQSATGLWEYILFTIPTPVAIGGSGGVGPKGDKGDTGATGAVGPTSEFLVSDHGAPWDGTNDDWTAVTATVAAAVAAGGGVVRFPSGTGVFNNPSGGSFGGGQGVLTPVNGPRITFKGQGRGVTTIKLTTNSQRAFQHASASTGSTVGNVAFEDFTVDCNNLANGNVGDHVLWGTLVNGSLTAQVNVQNVSVRRVECINVPNSTSNQQGRRGIVCNVWHGDINLPLNTISNIDIYDYQQTGGNYGISAMAQSPSTVPANVYHDDITIRRFRLFKSRIPTFFSASSGVHLCSAGWGRRCIVEDVYVECSEDNAIEIDNMTDVTVRDVSSKDCWTCTVLVANFIAAGDSYPTVTRINNGGTLALGATSIPVTSSAGFTVGAQVMIDLPQGSNGEVRTILSIPNASTINLTAATGVAHGDTSTIYQVGNMRAQKFCLENIRGRRTAPSTQFSSAVVIQNVNNVTPIGHVEINNVGWYRTGNADVAVGELIKCQTGTTNSPTGNPMSLTINGAKSRTENILYTGAGAVNAAPIYLTMRGPQSKVTIRDLDTYWQGNSSSGTLTFVALSTSGSAIDLDVDGWTHQHILTGGAASSKVVDLNTDSTGTMSWRFNNLTVRPTSDPVGVPRGLGLRFGSGYSSAALRPLLTADTGAGTNTVTVGSTTGFAVGMKVVVSAQSSTISEIATVQSLTGTVLTLAANVVNGHTVAAGALVAPLNQLQVTNSDFSGLGVAGVLTLPSDANVLAGIRFRNIIPPKPLIATSLTLAGSAAAFQVVDGFDGYVSVAGGTGTLIEWSPDTANWYTTTTQASGAFSAVLRVLSGEFFRVTYTVAPTVKRHLTAR